MILRELFYFNNDSKEMTSDDRYDSSRDDSVLKKGDTRKAQGLTLKQINRLRKAGDLHELEMTRDNDFFSKMYAAPPPAPAG